MSGLKHWNSLLYFCVLFLNGSHYSTIKRLCKSHNWVFCCFLSIELFNFPSTSKWRTYFCTLEDIFEHKSQNLFLFDCEITYKCFPGTNQYLAMKEVLAQGNYGSLWWDSYPRLTDLCRVKFSHLWIWCLLYSFYNFGLVLHQLSVIWPFDKLSSVSIQTRF